MGDFNTNLLDYASHAPKSDFIINFFQTAFFLAFIIQLRFRNILHLLLTTYIPMLQMLI